MELLAELERLCLEAEQAYPAEAVTLATIRRRLAEPIRVAIAGRVKAGKSTLLNALVGERLAPTDAGECTRIVTWYRHGIGYEVLAHLPDGEVRALDFDRSGGALAMDLGGLTPAEIVRLEVRWPARSLASMTLIDTPGLEGMDEEAAARTRRLLGLDADGERSEVDAVLYLMRHLHRRDADFLESFLDRSLPHPSPVNAVAVLSRSDEIGAARPDALDSAAAIARRYADDDRVRALCATVIPVAGLIAETGHTLREAEVASLRSLANLPAAEVATLLLSVDHFVDPAISPLSGELRYELLGRLGMFGVRYCLGVMRSDPQLTASRLSTALVEASGIEHLRAVLADHFEQRSLLLKARSALGNLKRIGLDAGGDSGGHLLGAIERLEASAEELAQLRLLHLVLSGSVSVTAAERAEIARLISDAVPAVRLGAADEDPDALRALARAGADRWRAKGAHPLTDRGLAEACDIVVRCYEAIHARLGAAGTG